MNPKELDAIIAQSQRPSEAWPGGVVPYAQAASPQHLALLDTLQEKVRAAFPDTAIPPIRILNISPGWREQMYNIAHDAPITQSHYNAARHVLLHTLTAHISRPGTANAVIYIPELLIRHLSAEELTAVIAHEMGHHFIKNSFDVTARVYKDQAIDFDIFKARRFIAECQADQFVPTKLKPHLATALNKALQDVDPEAWQWWEHIKRERNMTTHPIPTARIEAMARQATQQLSDVPELLFDTDCNIIPPSSLPRSTPETGWQR